MTLRLLLADDHELLRDGLRSILSKQDGVEVVGEAGDGRTAVRLARELSPDIVIMDIGMPDLNGIEAARQICSESPGTRVIALSMHTSDRMVLEMLKAGASGYVSKLSAYDEVRRAIDAVSKGQRYLSPSVAGAVVDGLVTATSEGPGSAFARLTPREREVLQLLAEGGSSKEIGATLHISPRTVDVHRKNIMDKLELDSVAALTRYAVREGLVALDD